MTHMRYGPAMPITVVGGLTRARRYTDPDTSTYDEHEKPRQGGSYSVAYWRALFDGLEQDLRFPLRRALAGRMPRGWRS